MRFIVDAQLPPALARWLSSCGHEALHVGDRNMAAASDREIWNFARTIQAVIITKDEDFARLRIMEADGPAIVWLRLPNSRRNTLLASFEIILPDILTALERGETLVEIV
jgi:predicted nuclease of predicted toxin-antitoxin system